MRSSYSQSAFERLAKAFGFFQLRCRDCDHRFTESIWDVGNLIYARCPLCYRLDLALWKPEQYNSPTLSRVLLGFGGKPRRCEACRKNFVSFRLCKEVYSRRKVVRVSATGDGLRDQPEAEGGSTK